MLLTVALCKNVVCIYLRRCVSSPTLLLRRSYSYLTIYERMNSPSNTSPTLLFLSSLFQKTVLGAIGRSSFPRLPKTRCSVACTRSLSSAKKMSRHLIRGFFPPQKARCNPFASALMHDGPDVFLLTLLASCLLRPSSFVEYTRFFTTADPCLRFARSGPTDNTDLRLIFLTAWKCSCCVLHHRLESRVPEN